jgi:ribonuclease BN (tRNA processing enzyme)
MLDNLFFVDSIYTSSEGENAIVTLLPSDYEKQIIVRDFNAEQLLMRNHLGAIKEGWYVYYGGNENIPFNYGNFHPFAVRQFREYYELKETIDSRFDNYINDEDMVPGEFQDSQSVHVVSYHVNVGHGNCSLILIEGTCKRELWMVDCSIKDKRNGEDYSLNLDSCINSISQRINLHEGEKLHIDRFFLTHAHYDHYNGIEYLINKQYINSDTIFYLNLHYQMASVFYNRILTMLNNLKIKVYEPVSDNSGEAIRFLHPEKRIYRSKVTAKGVPSSIDFRVEGNVNNSSAVLCFRLGGKSMVFPGDLERKGFENMSHSRKCSPLLHSCDYYAISHHGSFNGHPDVVCRHPNQPCPTSLYCAAHRLNKAILMGRNNAYPGIYNHNVINFWRGLGVLEYTEKSPHFLELDWASGIVVPK